MKYLAQAVCLISLATLVGCAQQKGSLSSGANDSNIIGGKIVPDSSDIAKVTVALYDTSRGALCSASILDDGILLTAAHCVKGGNAKDYRVIFERDIRAKSPTLRKVVAFRYNAKWNKSEQAPEGTRDLGDIAIVKFEGGLPAGYKKIGLLSDVSQITDGADVILAGYGNDDGVNGTGAGLLRAVGVKVQDAAFGKTEVELDQSGGKGACHGDSGGPAYIKDTNGKYALFGITSRGENDPHDTCGTSSVYTDAAAYKPWIARAVASVNKQAAQPQ